MRRNSRIFSSSSSETWLCFLAASCASELFANLACKACSYFSKSSFYWRSRASCSLCSLVRGMRAPPDVDFGLCYGSLLCILSSLASISVRNSEWLKLSSVSPLMLLKIVLARYGEPTLVPPSLLLICCMLVSK